VKFHTHVRVFFVSASLFELMRRSLQLLMSLAASVASMSCAGSARTEPIEQASPVRALPAGADTAGSASADALPPGFREAFAEADSRARTIAFWYQCVGTIARLRAGGTFGPAAAAPRIIYCERTTDGVPIGGVYDIDPAFRTVRRFSTVRLDGARPRYSGPIDTARVAMEAKLVNDVTRAITPAWTKLGRPFSVVPAPLPGGAMEAWAIPRATKARTLVTGGDVAYARNTDGTVRRIVDHTGTWTQVPLAAAGALVVRSAERDVAAVTDLVTARYHTDLGREVTVHTTTMSSALVAGLDPATGARVVWRHVAKPAAR
jgi:hypothetical protein